MKKVLLIIFAFFYFQGWGQGNMITINSTVPAQITICGPAKTFTITIYNPSPFLLTKDTLKLTLPSGIAYQISSVTGATELYTSIPNRPVFLLPNIPNLTTLNITFTAVANCGVMSYISGGGIIENNIHVDYTGNNTANYDAQTSATYIVRQPSLSITTITNQSYTGSIGDVYTRCITIINGGFGELRQFTLTDVHGSGIQITAVNKGTWTNTGTTETIVLNSADFLSVGDGDNLFENGESITVCETVHLVNCISVASAFEAFWGCNSQHCQSSVSSANVVFPNLIPNLAITPTSSMNSCLSQASPQQLRIINTGLGKATNIQLEIFQCGGGGSGYQNYLGSRIDTGSITSQVGLGATPASITPTSTIATAALACMTNPLGKVTLTIPFINAGDTVFIKWNTYSCCYNACTGVGNYDINGWRYRANYSNICQSNYVVAETWGRVYSRIRAGLVNNGSPSTLNGGQTGTFNFLFSYYENSYPVGPGAYWKFEFTLPQCLAYAGNLQILRSSGLNTWIPDSVYASGNTVAAFFDGPPPWNLTQAEVKVDLTVNCPPSCTTPCGGSAVTLNAYYIPNDTCACAIGVSCQSTSISFNCPCPCIGMKFRYFEMKRTSYGLPDNEAGGGNGLPDPGGSLDFTKIKTDRVMFGDTIASSFNGTVGISFDYPSWQYCFARSSISNGNRLTFVDATLTIYRGGAAVASCTDFTTPGNPIITNSGSTRVFKYNLSVPSHPGLLGYTYLDGDSVVFKPRYRVSSNIGNATPLNCYSSNYYYMSDIVNPNLDTAPGLDTNKFQCGNYNGSCSIIGYYFHNCCDDNYSVKSCDDVIVSQNYYLSIGPCCNNYAGGNLFPYEYRNWAHIKILTSIVPPGYDFISARFNQVRTAGTLLTSTSPWVTITPTNPNSDTLTFPVEQYLQYYGGTIPLSDDGFHGTLQVTIRPSCEVTPTISQGIRNNFTFETAPNNYLTGPGSASTFLSVVHDSIIYQAPDLFLQSTLPSVLAPDNTASWDICISNTSNVSNALNTWLSGPAISGVTIINLVDLGTSLPIAPVGSIYPVGTVNAAATRCFRITASFTSCSQDSIVIFSGWNCNGGYPTSVQTYPCTPKTILLKETPLLPALVVNITAPASTVDLCDTASYTIEGIDVQLGTAYNIFLTAILPVGVTIIPGTSKLRYPVSSPFFTVPNPTFIGGTTWQWNISAIDSLINADGMKGVLSPTLNSFKLTFDVVTNCGYTSGSNIAFDLTGVAACGLATGQNVNLSSALGITGAVTPYHTAITLTTTYISPCANNSMMKVSVQNKGPAVFSFTDSVVVILPAGVSFVAGSFAGLHNPPVSGVPAQFVLNGKTYLSWKLPPGVVVGDSSVFNFGYRGDPLELSCEITQFEAKTTSATNVTCVQSGNSCSINIATGDTTLAVFTYKAYLSLSNGHATAIPNPPGGETVTVNLDITNTGQAILTGANSIIQFYYDANANGMYNPGDVFLVQDALLITNNSTVPYSITFNVAAGQSCSIIAIIDTAVNSCVCNPSQLLVHPPLIGFGDSTLCSGQTITLSYPPVTGYTYNWTPTTGLSSSIVSNPLLTTSNLTTAPVSTNYVLSTNRMGCVTKDTIKITVNPIPVSNAGTDIVTCPSNTPGNIGAATTSGYTYLWSPATGLSSSTVSNPTATITITGVSTYTVTTTSLGCTSSDNVLITVNPLPTATVAGTTAICESAAAPNITFTGAGATAPYTFTYTVNGGANQTISTTSGNSVIVSAPSTAPGTFIYALVSVQESSSTACVQAQSTTATITVNPLPTATISGTTSVCRYSNSPGITFTGAAGTAPYTFTYAINGGTSQTIVTTGGNSVTLPAPTSVVGTFIYTLISVLDASSTTCAQAQTGIATVTVFPLPVANFSSSEVCLNQGTLFSESSTVPNGTVTAWSWDFGDGSLSNFVQNPIYIYSSSGTFSVSLIATSSDGCKDTLVKSVIVHPLPGPQFSTSPVSVGVCYGTTVQLTDASTIAPPDILQSWTWNFGDASALNYNQNNSHLYVTANSYTIHLTVFSNFGCSDSIAKPITINSKPVVNFTGSPTAGCEPLCVFFQDSSFVANGNNTHWTWDFGDGSPVSNSSNFEHCYTNDSVFTPVSFSISLTVTSDSGCVSSISKNNFITVYPKPNADFSVAPKKTTVTDPVISIINLSAGANYWNWNFGDLTNSASPNPISHTYPADTATYTITLITSTQYGCKDTASQTIIIEADFVFYIPNSFTPNGDGVNDYFFGKGVGIKKYDLWIFDRWGNLIFHADELNKLWDGKANHGKEPAQIDVYVWKVELTDVFDKAHKYIGTVTLVK